MHTYLRCDMKKKTCLFGVQAHHGTAPRREYIFIETENISESILSNLFSL